jgi:hypothetical protein
MKAEEAGKFAAYLRLRLFYTVSRPLYNFHESAHALRLQIQTASRCEVQIKLVPKTSYLHAGMMTFDYSNLPTLR